MAKKAKLTDEQKAEIAKLYSEGVCQKDLAAEYNVCVSWIGTICKAHGAVRPEPKAEPVTASELRHFTKRVRSVLWRQDPGSEKRTYDAWAARVSALQSEDGGGYTHSQAVVRASKEFPCLHRLFREYNLAEFDPNPDSHPTVKHFGKAKGPESILSEGIQQSYRDSLRWAIEAAGKYLRTNETPATCPCDAAYYLYRQAIEEPKDFMSKVGQIESKGDAETEAARTARKSSARAIQEIDAFLEELEHPEEESNEAI